MKRDLRYRYQESARSKDAGGGGGVFLFPSDTKFYKPKEARNRINLVPYLIKSKNHPLVAQGKAQIGDIDYLMDVWVHQRVGPGEVDLVCLRKNYQKACPACELADDFREKGKDEEYKQMRPSRRVAYNVINARNPESGLMVFTSSHYLFEHELIEEAIASGGEKGIIPFADVDEGRVVTFRGSMTSMGKNEYLEFKSFSFEERSAEERVTESMVEDAVSLDGIMQVLTYDQMQKALFGQDDDEPAGTESGGDKEEPRGKARDREESPPRRSEEKEERPARAREKEEESSPRREREEEKRSAPKAEVASKDGCPHGHEFGVDWDQKRDCSRCKVWDKCSDAYEAAKKK